MMIQRRTDNDYMRMALRQAEQAAAQGEVPVGSVAVRGEEVVARAYNQVEMLQDATAHAEMIALTQAATAKKDWRLSDVTLYVTKEPCVMCAGAMVNSRLGRLVYGCYDKDGGGAGSAFSITDYAGSLHSVTVASGVMAEECQYILQSFFRTRRVQAKEEKKNGRIDQ